MAEWEQGMSGEYVFHRDAEDPTDTHPQELNPLHGGDVEPVDVNADAMRTVAACARLRQALDAIREKAEAGKNTIVFHEALADHVADALCDRGFDVVLSANTATVSWKE